MVNAFIVHGRAELATLRLKDFLSGLGLTPIVLEEQDDRGLTIIEKFEHYARPCEVAFIVMSPDDAITSRGRASALKAARQNVMIELGWFMRHLGRNRVIILHNVGTEIPSDISGILYLAFQKDILETSEKIRQRLKGLGILTSP